jgi:hypothetical protein
MSKIQKNCKKYKKSVKNKKKTTDINFRNQDIELELKKCVKK